MADNLLNQYVRIPTRGTNTLDIFITTIPYLVTNVPAQDTDLSDHDLVDIVILWYYIQQHHPISNVMIFGRFDSTQANLTTWNTVLRIKTGRLFDHPVPLKNS